MSEKRALYFEAEAWEVWFCDEQRNLVFWLASTDKIRRTLLTLSAISATDPGPADKS
jgi:hypothetical protein